MGRPIRTTRILGDVLLERERQDTRFGQQDHTPHVYCAILLEEVGEVAHEINRLTWPEYNDRPGSLGRLRQELVQVAAVAVAMVEAIERAEERLEVPA